MSRWGCAQHESGSASFGISLDSQVGWPQRPLAVAALEDKIVQRAVVALLNATCEEDFLSFFLSFSNSGPDAARMTRWMRSVSGSTARR
jgi:hypothetical protein